MSFTSPIPGGTIGRTDQGVDISASPGAKLVDPVPGTSKLVGVIQNWYRGQPYYWFQVLTGPFKGKFWYVAEQVQTGLKAGQQIRQGQQFGTYAPSGTATEWGWSTASGETLAKATSGYTEGQVTPAGSDFATRVKGGRATVSGIPAAPGSGDSGPITRPGGQAQGDTSGSGVDSIFANYQQLIDAPRTAPSDIIGSGPMAPFRWWYMSFLGKWQINQTGPASQPTGGASADALGAVAATKGDYTPRTWAAALLTALSAPVTKANVNSIVAWEGREGGHWNNSAKYNPLNTTMNEPGATSMNSVGVKAYTSWSQGLTATVATLRNGNYGDIVAALRAGRGLSGGTFAGLSTWSGGGYSSI